MNEESISEIYFKDKYLSHRMHPLVDLEVVCRVISRILFILSAAFLVCGGLAYYFGEEVRPFILSMAVSTALAIALFSISGKSLEEKSIQLREAYLTVFISWLIMSLIGSLPYIFSGSIPAFIDAVFESASGFTTTGSSILTDIEVLPKSILFWRSLTHWIGGIGIIVLVILIMPSLQIGGYQLFTLESSVQEKIQPKIKSVGFRLLLIYIGLTLSEIILLLLGKMSLFESVCHAFGTVATGGFSPKNSSIAGYTPYVQYVVMIFMLLAGMNFVIHYYLFKGNFKKVKDNEEVRFYLFMVVLLGVIITLSLAGTMGKPVEESFREGFFQVISIVTCTGFATADYMLWPGYAWVLIFFAMFLGGSTGSTAGGIKMARHLMLIKNIKKMFRQLISGNIVVPLTLNHRHVSDESNNSILSFILLYFMVFLGGSVLMVVTGVEGMTAASSVATCMAGIGPGLGAIGPVGNFAHIPETGKIILTFLMLAGRLEIYTMLLLFSKDFWIK